MAATVVVALLLVLVACVLLLRHQSASEPSEPVWPYEQVPLLTDAEKRFYDLLKLALPEYTIFIQVQLSQLIRPFEDIADAHHWLARICRMSVDFVITTPDVETVLIAIELDDWTHQRADRQIADAKKDKALADAGVMLLRVSEDNYPTDEVMLRAWLLSVFANQRSRP